MFDGGLYCVLDQLVRSNFISTRGEKAKKAKKKKKKKATKKSTSSAFYQSLKLSVKVEPSI